MKSLQLCSRLFAHLDREGLRYCHWKSNDHLEEALLGVTDLDLLIHPDDRAHFEQALASCGLKAMIGQPESTYPGLGDWLGFDEESGELVHLHVHYRLILGRKRRKEYHLPIEERVLFETRHAEVIAIPRPEVELLLLLIRANVKLDGWTLLKHQHSSGFEIYPEGIRSEFDWLQRDTGDAAVLAELEAMKLGLDPERVQDFLVAIRERSLSPAQVRGMRRHVFQALAPYRWQTRSASFRRWLQATVMNKKVVRKRLPPRKKRTRDEGMILALAGADGSGKTTLSGDLDRWLVWKIRAVQCYLGIPKRSLLLRGLRQLRKLGRTTRLGPMERFAAALYWVWTARSRTVACRRSRRLAERGYVVLTDRYPLAEFRDMPVPMDGPRIPAECGKRQRWLASVEARMYERIERPDRVFVLQTQLETLRSRKTDLDLETHRMKADAVNRLIAGEGRILIDGERSYDEVLLDLKRRIWALL